MEHLIGFLENVVLVPILTALVTFLYTVIKRKVALTKQRRVLRLEEKDDKTIKDINCITANTGYYDQGELVTLGYVFEYMAVGELRVAFKKLFKHIDISAKMSPLDFGDARMSDLKSNLILIGGPFHNSITRELLFSGKFNFPFRYDDDANLHHDNGDGTSDVYKPQQSNLNNNFYELDYALIINIRNPKMPSKRLIALIGCRSIGCYGAAYFLSHELKKLHKVIKDDEYAIVVRCECDEEDIISTPQFIKYYPMSSEALTTPVITTEGTSSSNK